jgi:hypothetical protein
LPIGYRTAKDDSYRKRTHLLVVAIAVCAMALAAIRVDADTPVMPWWIGAVVITLVERIATFSYFIPTALRLMRTEAFAPTKAEAMASRWITLNRIRATLAVIGWLAALRGLSLPG